MADINEKPIIVKINEGEITNSLITPVANTIFNIDLYNGNRDNFNEYKLIWDENNKKFKIGTSVPLPSNTVIVNNIYQGQLLLNGTKAEKIFGDTFVAGTHLGEDAPTKDLIEKQHVIKCNEYNVNTKFDFIYVQMTTGVANDFGEDKYRKASDNKKTTASSLKKLCEGKTRLGFSHYLVGNPDEDAKEIGRNQARKFLKSIVGSETEVKNKDNLNGGMPPMVIFMDNITQPGYYGAAPVGVKKDLENF